jgi:glycogenin glucosyltransferase
MKHAYVTLICNGGSYEPGVEALGRSLHAVRAAAPLVLLATPDVPEEVTARLASTGWEVRRVEPLDNPLHERELLFARFRCTFTKLRAFGLEDIEKAVFLDADTLVLKNIDELFDRPDFSAAPDFFMPDRFNSGVMVLAPSPARFAAMEKILHESAAYDGGDQGFLNEFFADWWAMDEAHRLPARYNMHHFVFQFLAARPSLRKRFLDEVKIVHYTLQKPWMTPTVTGGASVWWERYAEGHPELDHPYQRRIHALEDWTFDSLVGALGGS